MDSSAAMSLPSQLRILVKDASLLAASKPSGLLSLPGKHDLINNVHNLLRQHEAESSSQPAPPASLFPSLRGKEAISAERQAGPPWRKIAKRLGPFCISPSTAASSPLPIHRLDQATSGLLLFGRTPALQSALSILLSQGRICKTYEAILDSRLAELERESEHPSPLLTSDEGIVSVPLQKHAHLPLIMVAATDSNGSGAMGGAGVEGAASSAVSPAPSSSSCPFAKPAVTAWRVLERGKGAIRVLFFPLTGRTHQLRLHAALPPSVGGLGCGILGDPFYSASELVADPYLLEILKIAEERKALLSSVSKEELEKCLRKMAEWALGAVKQSGAGTLPVGKEGAAAHNSTSSSKAQKAKGGKGKAEGTLEESKAGAAAIDTAAGFAGNGDMAEEGMGMAAGEEGEEATAVVGKQPALLAAFNTFCQQDADLQKLPPRLLSTLQACIKKDGSYVHPTEYTTSAELLWKQEEKRRLRLGLPPLQLHLPRSSSCGVERKDSQHLTAPRASESAAPPSFPLPFLSSSPYLNGSSPQSLHKLDSSTGQLRLAQPLPRLLLHAKSVAVPDCFGFISPPGSHTAPSAAVKEGHWRGSHEGGGAVDRKQRKTTGGAGSGGAAAAGSAPASDDPAAYALRSNAAGNASATVSAAAASASSSPSSAPTAFASAPSAAATHPKSSDFLTPPLSLTTSSSTTSATAVGAAAAASASAASTPPSVWSVVDDSAAAEDREDGRLQLQFLFINASSLAAAEEVGEGKKAGSSKLKSSSPSAGEIVAQIEAASESLRKRTESDRHTARKDPASKALHIAETGPLDTAAAAAAAASSSGPSADTAADTMATTPSAAAVAAEMFSTASSSMAATTTLPPAELASPWPSIPIWMPGDGTVRALAAAAPWTDEEEGAAEAGGAEKGKGSSAIAGSTATSRRSTSSPGNASTLRSAVIGTVSSFPYSAAVGANATAGAAGGAVGTFTAVCSSAPTASASMAVVDKEEHQQQQELLQRLLRTHKQYLTITDPTPF